jgi:hypothetical protein
VEVNGAPLAWYLDAWAVRDGVAFASSRPPDSVDARNTVFLSIPDLQPTPVGRITTALGATRRGFQAGLRDLNGVEVAFESIAQVREVVRRGYLAGGTGPGGAATPAFPLPPAEPGAGGGAYFGEALAGSPWVDTRWYEPGDREFHVLRHQVPLNGLARLVQRYAEATLVEWESALQGRTLAPDDHRRAQWGLREWYLTLVSRAIWADTVELAHFVVANHCRIGNQLLEGSDSRIFNLHLSGRLAPEQRRYSDQALLQSAPCPLLRHWDPRISRLIDKLLLALSTAEYFAHNSRVSELIPILLAAVLSAPAPPSLHSAFGDGVSGEEMVDQALGWLAAQTPQVELPAVAEMLISRYAWYQLEVPPRGFVPR